MREGRGLLLATLRLLVVIGLLAGFAWWWSRQKAPDFRVDQRLALATDGEARPAPAVRLGGVVRDALLLPCGRTLVYSVTLPGDHASLRLHAGHLTGQPELAVSLLRPGEAREELVVQPTTEQAWAAWRVPLPARAGENVTLELAARDGRGRPDLGAVFIADVVLESDGRGVDETEIPVATRAQFADLLARFGDSRRSSPPTDESARGRLDGPPCIPLPADEIFYVTAEQLPANARLDVVLHVGRPYPEGPVFPGRVVLQAGGEDIAALPVAPPADGRLSAESLTQIDLSRWAGQSVDLGLRRESAANLFVGLRELCVSTAVSVPRRGNLQRRGRNVLLVVADALRADRLGCCGHAGAATPAIDALAARGGLWRHALAPSSWTLPVVASLFTGTAPLTHGLGLQPGRVLSARLPTLAQSASWSGITTALFSSSPWVGRATGLDQGCETVVEAQVPAPVLAERALDWLEQSQQFEWFLTLHVSDAGYPHEPDPQDLARLPGPPAPSFVEGLRRLDSRPGAAEALALELGSCYDAEVAGIDRAVGLLTDWLAARDLLQSTLVVVAGAEGQEFFEHGGRLHGQTLHDEVLVVPVVIAGPGVSGPDGGAFVEDDPIDLVDVSRLLATFGRLSSQSTLQGHMPPPFSPYLPDRVHHAALLPFAGLTGANLRASRSRTHLRLLDVPSGRASLFHLQADPLASADLLAGPVDREQQLQADALARSFEDWERGCLAAAAAQAVPQEALAP